MSKILPGLPTAAVSPSQPAASRFAAIPPQAQGPRFEQSLAQASQQREGKRTAAPGNEAKQPDATRSAARSERETPAAGQDAKVDRTSARHDADEAQREGANANAEPALIEPEPERDAHDTATQATTASPNDAASDAATQSAAAVGADPATDAASAPVVELDADVDDAAINGASGAMDVAASSGVTLADLPAELREWIANLTSGAATQSDALASLLKDPLAAGLGVAKLASLAQAIAAAGLSQGEAKGMPSSAAPHSEAMLLEQGGAHATTATAQATDDAGGTGDDASGQAGPDDSAAKQGSPLAKLMASLLAQAQGRTASSAPGSEQTPGAPIDTNAAARPGGQAAAAAAPPLPMGNATGDADADADVNAARLARGLQSAVQQRGGAVTLRLTPPEMGTVRIEMQIRSGTVTAQFHTETEAARTMLNGQLAQLRQSLESQGLSVERLGAQTMPSSSTHGAQHPAQQGEGNGQADGSAHDGRSRGQYGSRGDGSRDDRREETEGRSAEPSRRLSFEQALNAVG